MVSSKLKSERTVKQHISGKGVALAQRKTFVRGPKR